MRGRNEHEGGFTLPELIVTVVIMGVVVAAISTALVQALKLPGVSQNRSAIAVQRSFLIQQFSDDVGNATQIFPKLLVASTCPVTAPPAAGTTIAIVQLKWDEPSDIPGYGPQTIDYNLVYKPYNATVRLVEIHRVSTRGGDEKVLTGYCVKSDASVVGLYTDSLGNYGGSGFPARVEKVALRIRDTVADPQITVTLEAAARATCAGDTTPGWC